MPTFWELVTANSTALSGSTLWEHLNSQEGGGTGTVNYFGDLKVDIGASIEVNLESDLSISVENSELRLSNGDKQSIVTSTQHRVRQG